MGSSSSKPTSSDTQHVFTSQSPVRFSPDLVNALQASSEINGTRAADLESHIQSRVNTELQRLKVRTDEARRELEERISTAATDNVDGAKAPGASDEAFRFEEDKTKDLSRAKVQKEIHTLKEKLAKRQLRDDVVNDKAVATAKRELVSCLRINDRRPLDCWQEVETFKKEVGRLEGQFLGRALQ